MKEFTRQYFFPAAVFYLLLFSAIAIVKIIFFGDSSISFLNWDAGHYDFIRQNGYDETQSAFFPLFPFLWKATSFTPAGISILNAVIFITGLSFLFRIYGATRFQQLLIASIPSFVFFFYPYTESLFFIGSVILLYGLKEKRYSLIYGSMFALALIRPTISVLLPGIMMVQLLSNDPFSTKAKQISGVLLATGTGLLLTFSIHYYYTGTFFSFFQAQESWGNKLSIPSFPLMSWSGGMISRLDGMALAVSLFSMVWVIRSVIQKKMLSPDLMLSLLYLAGCGLIVLFFRGGVLFSLNRFVFCSPFFAVMLIHLLNRLPKPALKTALLTFTVLSVYWLAFGSYVHIKTLLKFEGVALFISVIPMIMYDDDRISRMAKSVAIAGSLILFGTFYLRLLMNGWIG